MREGRKGEVRWERCSIRHLKRRNIEFSMTISGVDSRDKNRIHLRPLSNVVLRLTPPHTPKLGIPLEKPLGDVGGGGVGG